MTLRELFIRRNTPFRQSLMDPNEITICCPFCTERGETIDNRFRLGINVSNGAAHCFNCGYRNRSVAGLLKRFRIEGIDVDGEPVEEKTPEPARLPRDYQTLTRCYTDLDKMARRYLIKRRNVTPQQIEEKGIGVSFVGRYAYRVIIPCYDQKYKLQGLVARDFTGLQEPKYLNSLGMKILFNLAIPRAERVVLSEGTFKCLRIEQLNTGFQSAALLGHDLTALQLEQLQAVKCKEVVLWTDPDKVGRMGTVKVADKLVETGFLVGIVWPVHRAADEDTIDGLENTWKRIEGYSWGMRQRLMMGEV